ncbi:MAG TPA: nuclear transport factor 2 family protein [Longimicrobiales bacterium]|nr:nuclear transport factor 2 family protein [Longimicrobiales bacterium]
MRRLQYSLIGAIMLATLAAPAAAQQDTQTDEQAVRAVVDRLFDGMRSRDTTMMRSVFADEAQFYRLDGEGKVHISTPSEFITSISRAPAGLLLDEVLADVEIRIDGPLASVWTYYDFFAGDDFSHCGYDAFQMLKVQGEWKIVALADSRRQEDCRKQRSGG